MSHTDDWPPAVSYSQINNLSNAPTMKGRLSIIALLFSTLVPISFVYVYVRECIQRLGPWPSDLLFMDIVCGGCFLASIVCGWMSRAKKTARLALVLGVIGSLLVVRVLPSLISDVAATNAMEQGQTAGGD